MAYLSLYRKHRPRTFDEVVGQEHVTRTLVNAIATDTLHHAYLFTGQRGTGKTSTARILAAAINCEQGPTPEPCGTCDQCTSIVAGNNVDVIELDMASHGGVDDARDLRDRAVFAPAAARRKVYILDEVHMASTAAFNALLKVVEEPPSHVLFAMATTDPQKVLPTIMSRVQRLDLRRVPAAELTGHLRHLGEIEGFTLDDEAAAGVVAAGDGSVRDTLSVLEQVLAFAADEDSRVDGVLPVTGQQVTRVLGTTPFDLVHGVVDAIADADVAAALTRIQQLLDEGHDLRRFSLDLARHLRDLLVTAAAPGVDGLVEATADHAQRLEAQAARFGTDSLVRAVELVGEVLVEQRQGPPRLPLELAVARLATPGADGDLAALADRVARLEQAVGGAAPGGGVPAPASHASAPAPAARSNASAEAAPGAAAAEDAPAAAATPSVPADADEPDPPATDDVDADGPDGSAAADELSLVVEADETEAAAEDDATVDAATDDDAATSPEAGEDEPLAERARRRAEEAAGEERPPRQALADRPGTASVEVEPLAPTPGGDDLASVVESWEAILELVGDESRRAKAFYDPGTPTRLHQGVLLLSYPANRRFHAEQAKAGDMSAHLAAAIERATGLARVQVDVRLDDEGPTRPSVPVVNRAEPEDDEPSREEVAAVTESEQAPAAMPSDPDDVDQLLREKLGAQPLDDDA